MLLKLNLSLCLLFLCLTSISAQNTTEKPAIIPKPVHLFLGESDFELPENTTICYNAGAEESVEWLEKLLKKTYTQTSRSEGDNCDGFSLRIEENLSEKLGTEGYILEINQKGVKISAAAPVGLFYGIQSLRQSFPVDIENKKLTEKISLKGMSITDYPRYEWRGTMLDIARSFFGPEYIKKHIDRMALYKMNRLHLHLTDDQGWRIELDSKPKLTEISGNSAALGGRAGFLTKEEFEDLQNYAEARHITIIPEIDMPGHTYAALNAYPELNCENYTNLEPKRATPPELYHGYQVGWSKFCTTKPEVYDFVDTIIEELASMTHGKWIHLGGDEIEDEHYKDFVIKADSIVRKHGKTSIGWEEVTQAKVDTSLISQRWNGKTKSVVDNRYIESICTSFYVDHANVPGQENTNNWCQESGVSLENVYMLPEGDDKMLGVEAALWTEMVSTASAADNRYWPRLTAVAEVGWSPKDSRNFSDFKTRLAQHGLRLFNLGVDFFQTPDINWNMDFERGVF